MVEVVARPVADPRRMVLLYLLAGSVFAMLAARGLTLPLYANQLGASRFEVGALFSVSLISGAILSLPAGVLVDRFGARNLLAVSLLLTASAQIATALTTTVAPLFAWQVLAGVAAGMQQSAVFSAVTESVSRGRLGRAMGWLTLSMQLGFTLGPALAGLALRWVDVRVDIALMTGLMVFAIPGALVVSGSREHTGRGLSLREPLRALTAQGAFLPVVIGLVAMSLTWGTFGAFVPIFAKETLGLPSAQIGYLLAIQSIFNASSRPVAGAIVDRARRRWPIITVGVIAWSATTIVVSHMSGFWLPALVIAAGTPFIAVAFVAASVVFGDLASNSTRGVTMGIYGTVLFVALGAGPLFFGPLVQGSGYAAGFTASAIASTLLVLVMSAMQAGLWRRRREQAPLGDSETRAAATRRA